MVGMGRVSGSQFDAGSVRPDGVCQGGRLGHGKDFSTCSQLRKEGGSRVNPPPWVVPSPDASLPASTLRGRGTGPALSPIAG